MVILVKNVAPFCSCPRSLLEAKLNSFGLILLTEISRQSNVDSVMWLLVMTLTQIYNDKNKWGNEKYEM